jgi:hypothetical protein
MSHCSLYRLTFAAQELSDLFFLSKLESMLVLNWQHCGTTTKMVRSGSGCTLQPGTSFWGISGGPKPCRTAPTGIYYTVLEPCSVLEQILTGCLGMMDHWCGSRHALLGGESMPLVAHCHNATGRVFLSSFRLLAFLFAISTVEETKAHSRDVFLLA